MSNKNSWFVLSACSVLKTSIFSYWAKSSSVNTINFLASHIKCTADSSYYYEKCESESRSVMSDSLQPHGLYSPWNSPGWNTGVGSLSLLHGIFPTQGSNPDPPYYRQILYLLSHKRSPRILEWVACPFSSESSWPRNRTEVSCIAGRFFTNWAIREPLYIECIYIESLCCIPESSTML